MWCLTRSKNISENKKIVLLIVGVLILNTLLYIFTIGYDFFFDDVLLIQNNYKIKSLKNFLGSLQTKFFSFPDFPYLHYWRPMVLFSYLVDYHIGGLNPSGFHLINICINILNGILIFLIFYLLTKKKYHSFFISILFSLHPTHIQGVSWISGRTDLLSAFFILLAIFFFILFLKKDSVWFYISSVLFFIFALLSKENAVIFPFIILFLIVLIRKIDFKRVFLLSIPFFLFDIVYFILHSHFSESKNILKYLSFKDIILVFKTIGAYFKIILLPFKSGPYFSMRFFDQHDLIYLCLSIIALIILVLVVVKRKYFIYSFNSLIFLIFLLPLLNPKIIPTYPSIANRFAYIPAVFFGTFLVDVFYLLKEKKIRIIAIIAFAIIIFILVFQVFSFQPFFKSDEQYYTLMIKYYPEDYFYEPIIVFCRALHLANDGDYFQSLRLLEHAIEVNKNHPWVDQSEMANLLKANILAIIGNYKKSQLIAEDTLKNTKLDNIKYYAYLVLAKLHEKKGNLQKSMDTLKKAEKMGITADLFLRIALIHLKMLNPEKALIYLEKAKNLNPDLKHYVEIKEKIFRLKKIV